MPGQHATQNIANEPTAEDKRAELVAKQRQTAIQQADAARRTFIKCYIGASNPSLLDFPAQQKALGEAETVICQRLAGKGFGYVSEPYFSFEVDRYLWGTQVKTGHPFPFGGLEGYQGPGGDWRLQKPHSEVYGRFLKGNGIGSKQLSDARQKRSAQLVDSEMTFAQRLASGDFKLDRSVFNATRLPYMQPIPKTLAGDKDTLRRLWTAIYGQEKPLFKGCGAFELPLLESHMAHIKLGVMRACQRFLLPGVELIPRGVNNGPCKSLLCFRLVEGQIWNDTALEALMRAWEWMLVWWEETYQLHTSGKVQEHGPDISFAQMHNLLVQGIRDTSGPAHESTKSAWSAVLADFSQQKAKAKAQEAAPQAKGDAEEEDVAQKMANVKIE